MGENEKQSENRGTSCSSSAEGRPSKDLHRKAFGGLLFLLLVMATLLFIPAWTLDYWQAWAFLAVFGASALAITLYLMKKDPKLLERRVYAGPNAEKETSQKIIQTISSIGFTAILVVSALDHRFAWTPLPLYVFLAGDALVALGFFIVFLVYKENTFAAAWKFGRSRFCRNILSVCGMILRKSNRFFATSKHGGGWAFPRNLGDLICSLQNNELGLAGHLDFLVCL